MPTNATMMFSRPLAGGRVRRVVLGVIALALAIALTVYHGSLWAVSEPPTAGTRAAGDVGAILLFGLLVYIGLPRLSRLAEQPVRALWLPILAGIGALVIGGVLVALFGGPPAIDMETGLPFTLGGMVQVVIISLLEMAVAVVLLMSLRALVLFRRTQASDRNWKIMLALMAATAIVLTGTGPLEDTGAQILHRVLMVMAVVMMVANAFRLAWIVYLPFRQKMGALGLMSGMLILLAVLLASRSGAGIFGTGDIDDALSTVFSVPLSQFITMLSAFGLLYAVTALLALLFHLPTASALQQKSGEMEALQALARLSGEVFDHERLVDTIAGAPVESGVAQAAWLALVEPASGSLRPRIAAVHGLTQAQVRAMIDTEQLAIDAGTAGAPIVLGQAAADHRVHARPGDGIGSLVVLPLRAQDELLGALFATRAVSQGFERDDVAALNTFAAQAALALSNARLVEERIERERLVRELAIAREVQQRLLPRTLPCNERINCAGLSLPAEEIAGDFYDILELGDGHVGLIVADVSGKGASAAFHMAELKGIFQSMGRTTRSPVEFLSRANEALSASLHRASFISAIYAIIDQRSGLVTISRAGHCPGVVLSEDGAVQLLRPGGIGLGLDRGPLFRKALEEQQVQLRPGDTLILYSDGLVEARAPDGSEYGYDRLSAAAARHRGLEPEQLQAALLDDLRDFARNNGNAWEDDLTILILKWSGPDVARADRQPSHHVSHETVSA